LESDYIQKKIGEISPIVTNTDLIKSRRRGDKQDYHDTAFLAIIKTLNLLSYFYLEINAIY
jgi:hypothetical protein